MLTDDTEWVILDTETDGLYYPIHILEVAAQRMFGLEPVGNPFQIFLNHDISISSEAYAIHGYTREFLADNGVAPRNAHLELCDYIGNRPVSSHYLSFDWDRVLLPEQSRMQVTPYGHKGLCTWLLSRRTIHDTPTHRLDYLRNYFTLECSRPHSAKGDVESLIDLLSRVILPRLRRAGISSYEAVADFARLRPVAMCLCLVQGKDYEAERRKKRETEYLVDQLDSGHIENIPSMILEHNLIVENPDIVIRDKTFLFTGKLAWGARSKAQELVERFGGGLAKSKIVSNQVDYLVLGEDPQRGWTSLLKGGKLTKAFQKMILEPHGRLQLVLEVDFISAVNALASGETL